MKKPKKIITRIALWLTPAILLFSTNISLNYEERFMFFLKSMMKIAPIFFLVNIIIGWHDEHSFFLNGLYCVLFINAVVGAMTHNKLGTFDLGEFFKSTLITIAVIFSVYFSLDVLGKSIPEGFIEVGFSSSVQMMTLLFPISKILRNSFVLTNGKFPPEILIEKLYNYEKDGNLKNFLEFLNKKDENNTPTTDSTPV